MKKCTALLVWAIFALSAAGCSETIRHGISEAETTTVTTATNTTVAITTSTTTTSATTTTATTTTATTTTTAHTTSTTTESTSETTTLSSKHTGTETPKTTTTTVQAQSTASEFVGVWICASAEMDGVPMSLAELSALYGLELLDAVLTIEPDGTFSIITSVVADCVDGTWSENSGDATITARNMTLDIDIINGQLVLYDDTDKLFFDKNT